jgi:UDP-N-acetylglucosamine acyltransferase
VRIGDGTRIGPQVVIDGATTIGRDNHILGQANLGGVPQDLSYEDEQTFVEIGDRNTIREFVTLNRGTVKGGGVTKIGSDCLIMACAHVAHDCELGNFVILANNVLLAGHVAVGDAAIINGSAAAHQFATIGRNSYVGGLTRVFFDVPPFMIVEGHPARVRKVNIIGLERAGVSHEEIQELRAAYRRLFRSAEPQNRVLSELEAGENGAYVSELIEALRRTERGAKGRYREVLREEFQRLGQERLEGAASL